MSEEYETTCGWTGEQSIVYRNLHEEWECSACGETWHGVRILVEGAED